MILYPRSYQEIEELRKSGISVYPSGGIHTPGYGVAFVDRVLQTPHALKVEADGRVAFLRRRPHAQAGL